MFIRRTQTRVTATGSTYFTHRLVRAERRGDKVRQRTLLNLGRHFEVSRNDWSVLCQRIEEVLSGQIRLLPDCPLGLETYAQRIAAQLLARHADLSGAATPPEEPGVQAIHVDSLELIRLRSCLHELGLKPSRCAAAIGSIIARVWHTRAPSTPPGAGLGTRSALDELLGVDFTTMGPMQLYRASDALMAHREAIEHHLFNRAMDLFDRQPTDDLTNTLFEGGMHRQPKARRGHSKDKRTDCPLITLGLVLDALNAPRGTLVVMDCGIVKRFAKRFEDALTQLAEGLAKPRTQKCVDQIWQRIGRLKENSRGIAQHYDVQLDTDETGQRATAVRFTRRPLAGTMMTHPGVYCLRSSETGGDEATLWRTYSTLTDLEAVFRSLKSELGLRPIYHHKPIRAEGHLFISVIAYQLVQVIRTRLHQAGEKVSWTTLRRILEGQQHITVTFRRTDGATLHVRKAACAEPPVQAIYDALGIDPAPGKIRTTVV